jgi:5-methylcytosine-specific restriction endonuclease McrA
MPPLLKSINKNGLNYLTTITVIFILSITMGAKRSESYRGNKGGECSPVERLAHCIRGRWTCPYCGIELEADTEGKPTTKVHIDHVLAQVYGGAKGPQNQVAACASCNCSKKAQLLREFAEGRGDMEIVKRVQKVLKRQLPIKKAKSILNPQG